MGETTATLEFKTAPGLSRAEAQDNATAYTATAAGVTYRVIGTPTGNGKGRTFRAYREVGSRSMYPTYHPAARGGEHKTRAAAYDQAAEDLAHVLADRAAAVPVVRVDSATGKPVPGPARWPTSAEAAENVRRLNAVDNPDDQAAEARDRAALEWRELGGFRVGEHVIVIGSATDGGMWKIRSLAEGVTGRRVANLVDSNDDGVMTAVPLKMLLHAMPVVAEPDEHPGDGWTDPRVVEAVKLLTSVAADAVQPAPEPDVSFDDLVERVVRRVQYDTLRAMVGVVDGWDAGARENHEALDKRHAYEDAFTVADIKTMINDVAREVGCRLPVTS